MIKLNLQMFGGHGSDSGIGAHRGSGGGGGGNASSGRTESLRITDDSGNVMNIVSGRKYDVFTVKDGKESLFSDKMSANDTRDYLEGYEYDKDTGTYRDKENRSRAYRVKIHR